MEVQTAEDGGERTSFGAEHQRRLFHSTLFLSIMYLLRFAVNTRWLLVEIILFLHSPFPTAIIIEELMKTRIFAWKTQRSFTVNIEYPVWIYAGRDGQGRDEGGEMEDRIYSSNPSRKDIWHGRH